MITLWLINKSKLSANDLFVRQFGKQFTLRSNTLGDNLVTIATSTIPQKYNDSFENHENASPLIVVNDLKSNNVKQIYELSFTFDHKLYKGDITYLIESNLNPLEDLSLVTTWGYHNSGSSSLKGLIVFNLKNGLLNPMTGYPQTIDKDFFLTLTDVQTGKKMNFPVVIDSYYSKVTDLNHDGKSDLLYGDWKWNEGESHYQARPWNLRVYELSNDKFEIAKWWNNGNVFATPDETAYFSEGNIFFNYFINTASSSSSAQ